jgi:transposase
MRFHRNAKLGLAGRYQLVLAIEAGGSMRTTASVFNVSVATAHRWWRRWREAGADERLSLSCLLDRSSRPARSPRQLAPELEQAICECRRQTGWGPRLVADATGFAHSTVWKVLHRAGLSRPPRAAREPANRYEWPCPGDLLHVDTSEYARFQRPGHRLTGDRRSQDRHHRDGVDIVHAVVDDHTRLAYAEIHDDKRAATVAGFLQRALAFYADHGISVRRLDDRQRLGLHPKPRRPAAARSLADPPPHDRALPPTHERQGRALPPDDGPRMGLRTPLPLTP